MSKALPISVKKTCLELKASGLTYKQVYKEYFVKQFDNPQSFDSFLRSMQRWQKKAYPADATLTKGTYEGFVAHDATVQVNAEGEIVQAWIKQKPTDWDVEQFMDAIRAEVEPYEFTPPATNVVGDMLEIPLFDMHWGIAYMDHYAPILDEILLIIAERKWAKVVIPIGQDFFHNDSLEHGKTSNETPIEKVDMIRAVKDAKQFAFTLIDTALQNGSEVEVLYTPGNHDRSICWMFMQVLLERYGDSIVDDSFKFRKCVTYGNNAIMFTHGDSKRAVPSNLAHIFATAFPKEFASATTREVHAGHLHSESTGDVFGVMVRRLSADNVVDEWTDRNDYVGTLKRFMLFRWSKEKLKAIYYT